MSEHTQYVAAVAIRELMQHTNPGVQVGEGWAEDVVYKITRHVLDEIQQGQQRVSLKASPADV